MTEVLQPPIRPTGKELSFPEDELIVSKTNTKGIITYGNKLFFDLAGYTQHEIVGKPHNIVRHPEMPRAIFGLLWDRIKSGQEIFAYVNNLAKNGDNYWVFAHVTPSFDETGTTIGYHSSRRSPDREKLKTFRALYAVMREAEQKENMPQNAKKAGMEVLEKVLQDKGMSYDEFIFSL